MIINVFHSPYKIQFKITIKLLNKIKVKDFILILIIINFNNKRKFSKTISLININKISTIINSYNITFIAKLKPYGKKL